MSIISGQKDGLEFSLFSQKREWKIVVQDQGNTALHPSLFNSIPYWAEMTHRGGRTDHFSWYFFSNFIRHSLKPVINTDQNTDPRGADVKTLKSLLPLLLLGHSVRRGKPYPLPSNQKCKFKPCGKTCDKRHPSCKWYPAICHMCWKFSDTVVVSHSFTHCLL